MQPMASKRSRRSARRARPGRTNDGPSAPAGPGAYRSVPVLDPASGEVVDAPVADLIEIARERAEVRALTDEVESVAAMKRFGVLVDFVCRGRPATAAGNLTAPDAAALAGTLGLDRDVPGPPTRLGDLPETAHLFHWAVAAGFLEHRAAKVVAGPFADALEDDPVTACLKAATTLLEHGVLDGFQEGWRKSYVSALDLSMADLLVALSHAGDPVSVDPLAAEAWELVADSYGFEPDDQRERRSVHNLFRSAVAQLDDAGVVAYEDGHVHLTRLGRMIALFLDLAGDDDEDEDDLDPTDIDAESLLLMCDEEESDPEEVEDLLRAWCQSRPAEEAGDELTEAMLDLDDPDMWVLGFQALTMLEHRVADRKVRELQTDARLAPLARAWLERQTPSRRPRGGR